MCGHGGEVIGRVRALTLISEKGAHIATPVDKESSRRLQSAGARHERGKRPVEIVRGLGRGPQRGASK